MGWRRAPDVCKRWVWVAQSLDSEQARRRRDEAPSRISARQRMGATEDARVREHAMSLKATKEALGALAEHGAESCQRNDGCWACEERALLERARAEVAALTKAARVLGVNGALALIEARANKEEREAVAVLKRLAKETE
jgi:hypothetical protein